MSTSKNKAVIRRVFEEAMNKGDLAVADEGIASNYVFHGPVGQELKGPEEFKQLVRMYRTAFPDIHCVIEDMVAEGDRVSARSTIRGTHKGNLMGIAPTGKQVTVTGIVIVRFVGGREVEAWSVMDLLSMMQQLGVVPPMGQGK